MIDLLKFVDGCDLGDATLPPLSLPDSGRIVLSNRQREIVAEVTAVDETTGLPKYKTVALSLPKRGGKTLILAAEIARVLVCVPESVSVVLGPSERGARLTLWAMLCDLLRAYPHVTVGKSEISNPSIGSQVLLVPSGEQTVQGVSVRAGITSWGAGGGAFIDEAHEYESDPRDQASAAVGGAAHLLMSQTHDARSQCWLSGMVGVPSGLMGHYRALAEGGQVPGLVFVYEGGDEEALLNLNPLVTRGWLEQRKQEVGLYWYGIHFLNRPAEEASGIFLRSDLEAAKQRGRDLRLSNPLTREQWGRLRERWGWLDVTFGLDRATSTRQFADFTVLSALARANAGFPLGQAPVILVGVHPFPKGAGLDLILDEVRAWSRTYTRPWRMCVDPTQCFDLIEAARTICRVDPIQETQGAQVRAFTMLGRYFSEGRMILPCPEHERSGSADLDSCQGCPRSRECPTAYLVRELLALRMIANRTLDGARFVAARGHDDAAHATALAAFAFGEKHERGTPLTDEAIAQREELQDRIDHGEIRQCRPSLDQLAERMAARRSAALATTLAERHHKLGWQYTESRKR